MFITFFIIILFLPLFCFTIIFTIIFSINIIIICLKFFTIICNLLKQNEAQISAEKLYLLKNIIIDTAERIQGELGNRAKIEKICDLVAQEPPDVNNRVLGFVDREFREFGIVYWHPQRKKLYAGGTKNASQQYQFQAPTYLLFAALWHER